MTRPLRLLRMPLRRTRMKTTSGNVPSVKSTCISRASTSSVPTLAMNPNKPHQKNPSRAQGNHFQRWRLTLGLPPLGPSGGSLGLTLFVAIPNNSTRKAGLAREKRGSDVFHQGHEAEVHVHLLMAMKERRTWIAGDQAGLYL